METNFVIKKKPRIVVNVGDTQYDVVKHVSKTKLGWCLNEDFFDEEWDLEWTDNSVSPEKLSKMKPYQKINHFPGMYGICKKNYLAWNLNRMLKLFPNDYNFFPKTWVLPGDWIDFKNSFTKGKVFILKPESSCQGKGIFLVRKIEEVSPAERYVAQEYLKDPLLIDGLKFDLRLYVLVTGCNPLRVYIHERGLTRLATEPFLPPTLSNIGDMCMHLTNYAINKNSSKFVFNEDPENDDVGHKRSLKSTLDYLKNQGHDTDALMKSIESKILKTICAVQPYLTHLYKTSQPDEITNSMCFEVLGFDIILDSLLKPWVLEVNHSPSFTTDSPLDWKIKKKVIKDTLVLLGVKAKTRKKYYQDKKVEVLKRALTGKNTKETKEERIELAKNAQLARDKWENSHLGEFRKLYPCDPDPYHVFIRGADSIYTELTGTNISRVRKSEENPKTLPKPASNNKKFYRKVSPALTNPFKHEPTPMESEDPLKKPEVTSKILNKFDNYDKISIYDCYHESKLSLIQRLQDSIGKKYIKYKSVDIPSLQIQSIRLNKPVLKLNEINFMNGNYIMPRIFEFSPRIKLPSGFKTQEKKQI
jgi:tubulin polyglutamylase TTLL6/13